MPARSERTYVLLSTAQEEGLAFPVPSWWDLDALLAACEDGRVRLSNGDEAYLLSWARLLRGRKGEGTFRWEEAVPRRGPVPENVSPSPSEVLAALQQAQWVVIHREWVWIVPREDGPASRSFFGPLWWFCTTTAPVFAERFWSRFRDTGNPLWVDYVGLLSGDEARAWNDEATALFIQERRSSSSRGLNAWEREHMAEFARWLSQAVWVVVFSYEWESGLD